MAIFQSTLLMRGATKPLWHKGLKVIFQSTLLMRGATWAGSSARCVSINFNPRSSCEERHATPYGLSYVTPFQSTLLMRGATDLHDSLWMILTISIHAPHARSDVQSLCTQCLLVVFQSTLLMRGATVRSSRWVSYGYFNPRSSCEERQSLLRQMQQPDYFNPRSSCEERRVFAFMPFPPHVFQSTLLMRGATPCIASTSAKWVRHFNPRSSCEERLFVV